MIRRYRVNHGLSAGELEDAIYGVLAAEGLLPAMTERLQKSEAAGPEPERFLAEIVSALTRLLRSSALGVLMTMTPLPDLTKPLAVGVVLNDLRLRFQETLGLVPVAHSGGTTIDARFTAPLADLVRIGTLRDPIPDDMPYGEALTHVPLGRHAERAPTAAAQLRAQIAADAWFGRVLVAHAERVIARGDGFVADNPAATLDAFAGDLERLLATQTRLAYHTGLIRGALERGVGVRFQVAADACGDCKRLLLAPDGTPKTFIAGTLLAAGGPNRGPRKHWIACVVQHPWCRCRPAPQLGGRP